MKKFELLQTERLILRRPTIQDAQAIFSSHPTPTSQKDDTQSSELLFPPPNSIQDTLNFIQSSNEQWEKKMGYVFIVCSKVDGGSVIGGVGLSLAKSLTGVDDDNGSAEFKSKSKLPEGVARVEYYIKKEQWHKGYATEAVKKMIDFASEIGVTKLVAKVEPDNLASIRVLEKCGFQEEDGMESEMLALSDLGKEKVKLVGFGRSLSLSDPPPTLTWED